MKKAEFDPVEENARNVVQSMLIRAILRDEEERKREPRNRQERRSDEFKGGGKNG